MRVFRSRSRGQALVMVTIALIAMCGLMGLAVDLGWSFYVRKAAQAAADAAALAAAKEVYKSVGPTGLYACSNTLLTCQSPPVDCSSIGSGDLHTGCLYAQQNGFSSGGSGGRQTVTMESNAPAGGTFNTATGPVTVAYWVTARVRERVPQLFSSLLGNTNALTGAKATAAVADSILSGSLFLMNRQNDRAEFGNRTTYGVDLQVQANDNGGHFALQTSGNILLYSTCNGSSSGPGNCKDGNGNGYAGQNNGGGTIETVPAGTFIRGTGGCTGCPQNPTGSAQWITAPTNNSAGQSWTDPMGGLGQPLPPQIDPTNVSVNHGYEGGVIQGSSDLNNPTLLTPGNYYAIQTSCSKGNCTTVATGDPLTINGYVRFTSGSSGFGGTVIYGGITAPGSTNGIHFDPGVYVLAGVKPFNNSTPGVIMDANNHFILNDNTSSREGNSDAGELFILTDPNYVGTAVSSDGTKLTSVPLNVPPIIQTYQNNASSLTKLQFGTTNLQAGNNTGTYINLHGLNPDSSLVQNAGYQRFKTTLFWQDQRNSFVKHNPLDGTEDYSCSGGNAELPCTNTLNMVQSPEFMLQASPDINLYGVIYQPRGAWAHMVGGGGYSGPLQLISGALWDQGNANVNLGIPTTPITVKLVTLIE